ncbi:MAG: peptidyl-prolyl cis-trans isomerase [Verrucomicrobia bacterium]|nr:peptidyl-prolyl cis-trans isomerase [Verrucomicrobiota bacterium]MBI3868614.1 peptidyl-prolyl cis-trans isomerase [Verrucomicrobiota bacterium]
MIYRSASRLPHAVFLLLTALSFGLSTGCRPEKKAVELGSDVAATVAGHPIGRKDFESVLAVKQARDPKQQRQILEQMIEEESLYQAARAAKFHEDPAVASAVRQLIISRYRESSLSAANVSATDAELEAAYAANLERFTVPAMVSVSLIHLRRSPKATPEKRAEAERKATELWEQAKGATAEQFAALAQSHSEDPSTRYQGGQSGWMPQAGSSRFDPAVHAAIARLKEPGELAPLTTTSNGAYIIRLIARKPAASRPLAEVAEGLRYQIVRKKTDDLQKARLARLVEGVEVRVNESVLRSATLPAGEPTRPPPGPGLPTVSISQPKDP